MTTIYTRFETPLGEMLALSRDGKLTALQFLDGVHAPHIAEGWIEQPGADLFRETRKQLEEYAAGRREEFDLPLGLAGTPFQVRVWQEIAAIPFGHTLTYGELAQQAGSPEAMRAAGAAAGRNPVGWVVPCHRVIGKNGSLTGYAAGVERKRALLEFEAARAAGQPAVLGMEASAGSR